MTAPVRTEVSQTEVARPLADRPTSLVDLLDRVLATGVVVTGEVVLSIADVDLVYVSLRALISSVRADMAHGPREER